MKQELINVKNEDGKLLVSGKELHDKLGIKVHLSTWFKRMYEYGFEENIDYSILRSANPNGGIAKIDDYIITINMAEEICVVQKKNKMAGEILEYLMKKDNREVMVLTKHTSTRFELSFGEQLEETLKPLGIKIKTQKSMFGGKYRIDFYLPEYNLAIEYDEEHHNEEENKIKDKIREEEIKNELHCEFIRLDYKKTDAYNVGLVLKKIFNR